MDNINKATLCSFITFIILLLSTYLFVFGLKGTVIIIGILVGICCIGLGILKLWCWIFKVNLF